MLKSEKVRATYVVLMEIKTGADQKTERLFTKLWKDICNNTTRN